jgi:hypothetical protein
MIDGDAKRRNNGHSDKSFCVNRCVTRMDKNGQIADYAGGTEQAFNTYRYSGLRMADDLSEFLQKCRFGIRKPPFYPLNYGNT